MTVFNLGSINADHVYRLPHLPAPGETLAALSLRQGLGGKGANQSVAVARSGAPIVHIGAIGPDGAWLRRRMEELGVDTTHIRRLDTPSGHAIINVDASGENAIVIFPGANREITSQIIGSALAQAQPGDSLLMQNETSGQTDAARVARDRSMRVVYSAAPFEVEAATAMMPLCDLLIVNQTEADQLCEALRRSLDDLPVPQVLVTLGAEGAEWRSAGQVIRQRAFSVTAVDTTGAGDCFAGFFTAARDMGHEVAQAMELAAAAAALQVTRAGAADAMPDMSEVRRFLGR
ncbi:ribokinase [Brevirhabdus sp.]|uniref:ribokinase n=1 Tax=Brevirhabdus sp. TaxID=2004514 RepID=UPI004059B00B